MIPRVAIALPGYEAAPVAGPLPMRFVEAGIDRVICRDDICTYPLAAAAARAASSAAPASLASPKKQRPPRAPRTTPAPAAPSIVLSDQPEIR